MGGPEGILESLAERMVECEKAFLAVTEVSVFEDCFKKAREIAVLSITEQKGATELSEALDKMKLVTEMTSMIRIVLALASRGVTLHNPPYPLDDSSIDPFSSLSFGTSYPVETLKVGRNLELPLMLLE